MVLVGPLAVCDSSPFAPKSRKITVLARTKNLIFFRPTSLLWRRSEIQFVQIHAFKQFNGSTDEDEGLAFASRYEEKKLLFSDRTPYRIKNSRENNKYYFISNKSVQMNTTGIGN
jgi:hypothetical protein